MKLNLNKKIEKSLKGKVIFNMKMLGMKESEMT